MHYFGKGLQTETVATFFLDNTTNRILFGYPAEHPLKFPEIMTQNASTIKGYTGTNNLYSTCSGENCTALFHKFPQSQTHVIHSQLE